MTPSVLMDVRGGIWAFHRCQIRAADGAVALGLYGFAKVFAPIYAATRASELSALCWFSYHICGWAAAAVSAPSAAGKACSVIIDVMGAGAGVC